MASFRARANSPRGGEGHNVEGGYSGQISTRGETITLLDPSAVVVASLSTTSAPSAAQEFLRITELHFAPPGGRPFEFIELKNIGPAPLDLAGVHFSDGVEITLSGELAPGAFGIVVADPANFPGLNVLGTFTGSLNNAGEQLTLRDASGENILSFEFDGDWFPLAREGGYSIGILDDGADWSSWDLRSSWALSSETGGSPGAANPEPSSNSYAAWSALYFTPEQLEDEAISRAADASGDGIANLIKYALGLDPTINSRASLPSIVVDRDAFTIEFQRLQKAVDLTLSVEVSTDLSTWLTTTSEVSSTDNGDGTESVTFRSDLPISEEPCQFMRVRVTQN